MNGCAIKADCTKLRTQPARPEKKISLGEDVKNSKTIISATAMVVVLIFAGLGCSPAANTNVAKANANANTATNANAQSANVNVVPVAETNSSSAVAGSLATPSDAYRTAYELRKRKDVQGLKNIMSPDIKAFLTMMGSDEKKSLDDMLKEMCEKPQAEPHRPASRSPV